METDGNQWNALEPGGIARACPFPAVELSGRVETAETVPGVPAAILAGLPDSEEAEARERARAEAEANRKRRQREERFSELCPPLYRAPEIVKAMRERVPAEILRRVFSWRPGGLQSGLLLFGPSGGFKTTMLFQILRRVMVENGERPAFLSGETLARDAAAAYGNPAATAEWLGRFKKPGWLFMDDLFKGTMTPSASLAIFEIVEYRTARFLPTVATTNPTGERIEASARDPAAQETIGPILRRIRGDGPRIPGFFECIRIPAPGDGMD
jgi:DNA replication protein DnaC